MGIKEWEPGILGGMIYSDVFVLEAVKALLAQHGEAKNISYAMICTHSGAPRNTVIRALKRLQAHRQLEAVTLEKGYSYRIPHEQQPDC